MKWIPPKSQTGGVLLYLAAAGALGIVLLLIQALGQSGWQAGWRYLFVGGLAAIVGLGVGAVVGLVFGLPESSQPIAPTPSDRKADGSPEPNATASPGDWYRDSSSLERIATWLTGAIIALSLANFNAWTTRFDRAATAVGAAMDGLTVAELNAASKRAAEASAVLRSISIKKGESNADFAARREAAIGNAHLADAVVLQSTTEAEVPGGLLLGGYALLGFVAAYLWTRRYLPAELASGRREMRQQTRLDAGDAAAIASAKDNDLAQKTAKAAIDPAAVTASVKKAEEALRSGDKGIVAEMAFIAAGAVGDDPWKGQFNGTATSVHAEMTASVKEVSGRPGLFLVTTTVRGRDAGARRRLAGTQARLYLHPTFPDPIIRLLSFDANGVIEVLLSAVGAFTLGVQLVPSGELLELDLSGLQDAPIAFRLN